MGRPQSRQQVAGASSGNDRWVPLIRPPQLRTGEERSASRLELFLDLYANRFDATIVIYLVATVLAGMREQHAGRLETTET